MTAGEPGAAAERGSSGRGGSSTATPSPFSFDTEAATGTTFETYDIPADFVWPEPEAWFPGPTGRAAAAGPRAGRGELIAVPLPRCARVGPVRCSAIYIDNEYKGSMLLP
jgi:hypothetical protein